MGDTMHVNVHFDDQTARQLNSAAEKRGESLDALIGSAASEWLALNESPQWPEEILAYKGMSDIPLFEASRDKFMPLLADPLA